MGRVRVRDVASLRLVNPAARATPGPVLTDVRTPATATATASWPPALSFSLLSSDRPDLLRAMAAGQLPSAACLLVALFIPAGLSRKSMGRASDWTRVVLLRDDAGGRARLTACPTAGASRFEFDEVVEIAVCDVLTLSAVQMSKIFLRPCECR